MKDKFYWIWLTKIKGLGSRRIKKLLDYFENVKGIWKADSEELIKVEGIGRAIAGKIITSKSKFAPSKESKKLNKFGVEVVTLADKCYPKILKEIYDAPPVLYYQGDLAKVNFPKLSIVGSRKCTNYGLKIAKRLAKRLAQEGIIVVSGMARGIDTAAHQGALQRGETYAILGSGLDTVYPPENKGLMKRIIKNGAVLTPFPVGTKPLGSNFPVRNRIISGLSLGTIVVEATKKSGSLITANLALNQGREVFAIPGDITRKQSVGTNDLIKSGAKLVQNLDDILEEIPLLNKVLKEKNISHREDKSKESDGQSLAQEKKMASLSKKERKIYQLLSKNPKQFENIINKVKINSALLNSILLKLEIKGLIIQLPGKKFKAT